jgi:hypothetical protein
MKGQFHLASERQAGELVETTRSGMGNTIKDVVNMIPTVLFLGMQESNTIG